MIRQPSPVTLKKCTRCKQTKPIGEFGNDSSHGRKDGKYPYCKVCVSEMRKTTEERKRAKEYVKKRREASPELRSQRVDTERMRRYKNLYDITIEEYEKILEFQDGGCAICGRKPKNRRLAVDHDHKTGEVRGLLCHICNKTLHYNVDSDWLFEAYQYLEEPPASIALGRTPVGKVGSVKRRRKKKKAKNLAPVPSDAPKELASHIANGMTVEKARNLVAYLEGYQTRSVK